MLVIGTLCVNMLLNKTFNLSIFNIFCNMGRVLVASKITIANFFPTITNATPPFALQPGIYM